MSDKLKIVVDNFKFDQFFQMAEQMPYVQTYLTGLNARSTPIQVENSRLIKACLEKEFAYFLNSLTPLSWHESDKKFYETRFVTAWVENKLNSQKTIIGFSQIKAFSFSPYQLEPDLIEHLQKSYQISQKELFSLTYDCVVTTSVNEKFRRMGISKLLQKACVDVMVERNLSRGGFQPTLIKLSSFEPMGKQYLTNEIIKIAQSRQDILFGFGTNDLHEYKSWLDWKNLTDFKRTLDQNKHPNDKQFSEFSDHHDHTDHSDHTFK